ncbi:MAG: CAP domain-containing protein [Nocardioidaceae bacterium]|nr:CAP domain-containing protein [Nocardioidaceae bacterium]MCL2614213.1 CAP domain-containing protein [Nocardioidaceae bacterium]
MGRVRGAAAAVVAALVLAVVAGGVGTVGAPAEAHPPAHVVRRAASESLGRRVLALTNRRRRQHDCGPLHWQAQLRTSAQAHTDDMASSDVLAHLLAHELGLVARILRAGYHPWHRIAENIAVGYPDPTSVVAAWMQSPEHRRNILDCHLHDLGVGVTTDPAGTTWWTQDFGQH